MWALLQLDNERLYKQHRLQASGSLRLCCVHSHNKHTFIKYTRRQAEHSLPVILRERGVNDFPRPLALCSPPCLRSGRNKKRIVRVDEKLRWWLEDAGIYYIEDKQRYTVQRPVTAPPCPLSSFLRLSVLAVLSVCSLLSSILSFFHIEELVFSLHPSFDHLTLLSFDTPFSSFPSHFLLLSHSSTPSHFLFPSLSFLSNSLTLASGDLACLPQRPTWKPNIYVWVCVTVIL